MVNSGVFSMIDGEGIEEMLDGLPLSHFICADDLAILGTASTRLHIRETKDERRT